MNTISHQQAIQQNSIIAGLRATNDAFLISNTSEENKGVAILRLEDNNSKPHEYDPQTKKQKIPRSDSISSSSGRKYLVPTLSDPAVRNEKERLCAKKKKSRHSATPKNLPHVTESSEQNKMAREIFTTKTFAPKILNVSIEIRDWWSEQLNYTSQSSEEEE